MATSSGLLLFLPTGAPGCTGRAAHGMKKGAKNGWKVGFFGQQRRFFGQKRLTLSEKSFALYSPY
jgi:hypothetical protein